MVTSTVERYGTFWPRLRAGFIDGMIFMPLGLASDWVAARTSAPVFAIWFAAIVLHAYSGQTIAGRVVLMFDTSRAPLGEPVSQGSWILLSPDASPWLASVYSRRVSPEARRPADPRAREASPPPCNSPGRGPPQDPSLREAANLDPPPLNGLPP